jgi:hypothetical protein
MRFQAMMVGSFLYARLQGWQAIATKGLLDGMGSGGAT